MSAAENVYPFEQAPLDLVLPEMRQKYRVTSPDRTTPVSLEARMRVKVTGYGYVAKLSASFLDDENAGTFTVVLDDVELEEA